MAKQFLTKDQVEKEIETLKQSPYVKLARYEIRLKNKRRQYLYQLRNLDKRGRQLEADGMTPAKLEEMLAIADEDIAEENREE